MKYKQEIEKIERTANQKKALAAIRQIELIMLADPKHIFSVKEVVMKGLIPWFKHRQTVIRVIERGLIKVKIVEAKDQYNKRYKMKGKDIIKYLKEHSGL